MKLFSASRPNKATYLDLLKWLSTLTTEQLQSTVTIFDWDGLYDTHAVRKDLLLLGEKGDPELNQIECIKFLKNNRPVIGIDSQF